MFEEVVVSQSQILFRAFNALLWREIKRFMRYWLQTLVSPILTTLLYFLVFGTFLGKHMPSIGSTSYIQFIAPGLIMMTVIYNAYLNTASSLFGAKFQKYIEEVLVSPLPGSMLLLAYVLGGVVRGLILAIFLFIASFYLLDIKIYSLVLAVSAIVLISCLFSLLGFINAIYAKRYEAINFVLVFVLTPLSFLGGVFYATSMLPKNLAWINTINPVYYLVNMLRYAFFGVSEAPLLYAVGIISFLIVGAFLFTVHKVQRRLGS